MQLLAVVILGFVAATSAGPLLDGARIVGGQLAEEGTFKYQMSFRVNGDHHCGCSLIDPSWVLTAAHCLTGLTNVTLSVGMGSVHLKKQRQVAVAGAWYHADFDPNLVKNDIGLVKLAEPVSGSDVQIIGMGDADAGDKVTASGWGLTKYEIGADPEQLHYIQLEAMSSSNCKQYWSNMNDNEMCTTSPAGHGVCVGDSGGPLVYGDKQVGIVSYGQPCAMGVPDVFTRPTAYRSWISDIMQNQP